MYTHYIYRYTGSVQLLPHSFLRVTMIFLESVFLGGESAGIEEVQATRRLPHYYPPTRQYPKKVTVLDGGFLKWWVSPTTVGFPTKDDHFGVFWGYHHLRKHPDGLMGWAWMQKKR